MGSVTPGVPVDTARNRYGSVNTLVGFSPVAVLVLFLNLFSLKLQPFCDGSHKTEAPGMAPHRFVPEKDCTVWLCGCKYTHNPPYCDGTHNMDFIKFATLAEEK